MSRKTLSVITLLFCCTFGYPQNGIQIFYRRTTVDPVRDFFSRSCNLQKATCVDQSECEKENISKHQCSNTAQICCMNQYEENNNPIVFPESTPRNPVIMTTRKQITTIPTRRATTSTTTTTTTTTTATTTTTTTTEESIGEWLVPDCGTQQSNSIGRTGIRDSNRGEFPWNVELYSNSKNFFGTDQDIFLCGGTLIDNFVVLTSGNCVNSKNVSNLFVRAGVWDVTDISEKRQMRKVEKIIRHPHFKQTSRESSLALLILDDQVDFSRTVNRVCLPEPDIDFTDSLCFLTGWGGTGENPTESIRSKMKVVDMLQLSHKDCRDKMRRTLPNYNLPDSFQCANEESENHVCSSDVGSPLICTIPGQDSQFYQAGIFVWNRLVDNLECINSRDVINLYTDITKFKSWIDAEMEKLERNKYIYTPQLNYESSEALV